MIEDTTGVHWTNYESTGQSAAFPNQNFGQELAGTSGSFSNPGDFVWYNGDLYFTASDSVNGQGQQLWEWNGTKVTMITDFIGTGGGGWNANVADLTVFNGNLYFSAATGYDTVHGFIMRNLCEYNGTTVTVLPDVAFETALAPDGTLAHPDENVNNLVVYDNALYFSEDYGVYARGLYKYDGSTFTHYGFDYNAVDSTTNGYSPLDSPVFTVDTNNNTLCFFGAPDAYCYSGPTTPTTLIVFNGSTFSAVSATDGNSIANITDMVMYNGKLYLSAEEVIPSGTNEGQTVYGQQLYCYDGTNAFMVADINTGNPVGSNPTANSNPSYLTVYNGALYFQATDGIHGNELFTYDGTNLTMVTQTQLGAGPQLMTVYNGNMYFDNGIDHSLYEYDGTYLYLVGMNASNADYFGGAPVPAYYAGAANGVFYFGGGDGSLWQYT